MALSNSQTRCLGRSDLSPMAPACPKRHDCARCADIAGRDSYAPNPVLPDVQLHLCSDPELSQFVPVEVVGHERNSATAPDMVEPLPSIPQRGVFLATESASSMGENTVSGGAL